MTPDLLTPHLGAAPVAAWLDPVRLLLDLTLGLAAIAAYRGFGGRRLEGYGRLGRSLCGGVFGLAALLLFVAGHYSLAASMPGIPMPGTPGIGWWGTAWARALPLHGAALLVLGVAFYDRLIGLAAGALLLLGALPFLGLSAWSAVLLLLPVWLLSAQRFWLPRIDLPPAWQRAFGRRGLAALWPALPLLCLAGSALAQGAYAAAWPAVVIAALHIPTCLGIIHLLRLEERPTANRRQDKPSETLSIASEGKIAPVSHASEMPFQASAKPNPAILQRTIADLPEGIAVFDAADRLVAVNAVYRDLHAEFAEALKPGAAYADLMRLDVLRRGATAASRAPAASPDAVIAGSAAPDAGAPGDPEATIADLLDRHRHLPWRQEIRRTNGQWLRLIESRASDGGTLRIVSDITAMKTRELRLTELAERNAVLATAIASVASGVLICDALAEDQPITFVNAAFCRITGYSADEAIGRNCRFLQGRDSDPGTLERIRRAIEQRRPVQVTLRNYRKDGKLFWNDLHISPVVEADGSVRQFIGIISDVTARIRTEESLRDAKNQAELANRSKTEFLANISHELRTPLNAIIGFSQVMRMGLFGQLGAPQYEGYASDIHDSGQLLLSLINDLLDLSKIEAGHYTLAPERCAAAGLVDACLRLVRDRAVIGGLRLTSDIAHQVPDLFVDRRAAMQIVTNLLTNAVKFTPSGGAVTLSVTPVDPGLHKLAAPFVEIAVRDTGIGIAKADIPKVLAAFGQVDNAMTRKHQGTGLGLPIVKALTERHGGQLLIEGEPGKGTTVRVTLPAVSDMTTTAAPALAGSD